MKKGLAGLLALLGGSTALAADLQVGEPAPEFRLRDQTGQARELKDFRGRWVVLYFYPKDDTPGCTTEACNFRDAITAIAAQDAQVLGISLDDQTSHSRFAEKYRIPFPLLSDGDGQISRRYGALWSLGPMKLSRRHSFIIDPSGRIAKIYRLVNPERHSGEILRDLKGLRER